MQSLTSFLRTIRIAVTICMLAWGVWTLQQIVRNHTSRGLYDTPNSPYVTVTAAYSQPHLPHMMKAVLTEVLAFWRFGN